jgi:hypothetical protein
VRPNPDTNGEEHGIEGKPMDWGHNLKTRETFSPLRHLVSRRVRRERRGQDVILANGKPAVELSFRLELDFGPLILPRGTTPKRLIQWVIQQPYVLSGHLDRVVEFSDGIYVMDRKTSSTTIGSYYFDGYNPDNQMSLYTFASKVIYQTPVRGVIIDAAQIAVGFTRFSRGFTFRTEAQTEEWLENTRHWLALAEQYATEGFWPMNDKSCHQYGGCAFRKVCSKSPEVRQKFLESDCDMMVDQQLRAVLTLGKYRVIERQTDGFRLSLGGTTEMTVKFSDQQLNYDVRSGDLLTLYTEVFINPPKGN